VEPGIAKRTSGCTVLPTTVGKRVQAVNREACQPVIDAQALVATADEVAGLQAKLDAAREVIAKGAPKAADPLVANVQAFLSTGIDAAAVLSLIVALIVELGAPVCWMIWQMSEPKVEPGKQVPVVVPLVPNHLEPVPPKPRGTRKVRSETQFRANLIAKEMRARGEVPKFHIVRNEYQRRFGTRLPKVTAHRACA
jgi:hypothetical protein